MANSCVMTDFLMLLCVYGTNIAKSGMCGRKLLYLPKREYMKKAVYIAILLWFARKVLGKVRSPGVRETFRVCPRCRPGEPGYDPDLDDAEERMVKVYGCGIHRYLMGSVRDDLSNRQWREVDAELSARYCGRLTEAVGGSMYLTTFLLDRKYPPMDDGELPPGVAGILSEIERFVRGVRE